jgi:hypothetical protein
MQMKSVGLFLGVLKLFGSRILTIHHRLIITYRYVQMMHPETNLVLLHTVPITEACFFKRITGSNFFLARF